MRTIYCDTKDCLNSEIIDSQLHNIYGRPDGWRELRVSGPSSTLFVRKEDCPDCTEKIAVFQSSLPSETKRQSLEDILKDIVQEVVQEELER